MGEVERGRNKVPGCYVYEMWVPGPPKIMPVPGLPMAAVSPGQLEILAILIHTESYPEERFTAFFQASIVKARKQQSQPGMQDVIRLLCQDYSFWEADGHFKMVFGPEKTIEIK